MTKPTLHKVVGGLSAEKREKAKGNSGRGKTRLCGALSPGPLTSERHFVSSTWNFAIRLAKLLFRSMHQGRFLSKRRLASNVSSLPYTRSSSCPQSVWCHATFAQNPQDSSMDPTSCCPFSPLFIAHPAAIVLPDFVSFAARPVPASCC